MLNRCNVCVELAAGVKVPSLQVSSHPNCGNPGLPVSADHHPTEVEQLSPSTDHQDPPPTEQASQS